MCYEGLASMAVLILLLSKKKSSVSVWPSDDTDCEEGSIHA